MVRFNDPRKYHRPFFGSLLFTKEGDLDLSWLFVLTMGVVGVIGFLYVTLTSASIPIQIAAWSFLGSAFMAVLIAAIPIAKAKILASSNVPGDVGTAIASTAMANVEASTDIYEINNKINQNSTEVG